MKTFYYILIAILFSYATTWAQWANNGVNLTTSDNVGIGTNPPSYKLDVNGTTKAAEFLVKHPNSSSNGRLHSTTVDWVGLSQNLSFVSGNTFNLDNSNVSGWALKLDARQVADAFEIWRFPSGSQTQEWSTSKILFKINNQGKVGIGTTNPDAKLAVNGDIHAKEVRVNLNGWPDFVFNNDYVLPTLDQVEAHIKKNGHLKDIPCEAEVKENGINLGEMDAKLLQKIEELTLYMIELNKKVEKLEAENSALKSAFNIKE